jgi:hypothetical protein
MVTEDSQSNNPETEGLFSERSGELLCHIEGEHFLHLIDIDRFGKLLDDARILFGGNPDFQLCIQLKRTGSLYAKSADALVRNGYVFGFASGDTLLVDQN